MIKVAAIQHSIVLPTNEPIREQKMKLFEKIGKIIEKGAALGVNIVCLTETWNMPFGFCTRQKMPWCEYGEDCENGPTTMFLKRLAQQYRMVIISPILERDSNCGDILWNTAVVISECGKILGKQRKNHIPMNGECEYYTHGTTGPQVFNTTFGIIGVTICFDRHHPQNWMAMAMNGAEIVFNPATTAVNEHWWPVEARSAAFDHSYYTVAINRVGTEKFTLESGAKKVFGPCFGSTYITAPDGGRTKSLSRHRDGMLYAELDLDLCKQMREKCGFHESHRLSYYKNKWIQAADTSYIPQIIPQK
ncbi:beta-ureidopropionase-like isoform X2 [Sitodiplosis mosellana]|nr:beta-ureidopropionase-like isoform X2 [Sitodiplosis mosellana]